MLRQRRLSHLSLSLSLRNEQDVTLRWAESSSRGDPPRGRRSNMLYGRRPAAERSRESSAQNATYHVTHRRCSPSGFPSSISPLGLSSRTIRCTHFRAANYHGRQPQQFLTVGPGTSDTCGGQRSKIQEVANGDLVRMHMYSCPYSSIFLLHYCGLDTVPKSAADRLPYRKCTPPPQIPCDPNP